MFGTSSWDGNHVDEVPGLPPEPLFFPYVLAHDVIDFVSNLWVLISREDLELTRS
jgi:salicylate hydroxylase